MSDASSHPECKCLPHTVTFSVCPVDRCPRDAPCSWCASGHSKTQLVSFTSPQSRPASQPVSKYLRGETGHLLDSRTTRLGWSSRAQSHLDPLQVHVDIPSRAVLLSLSLIDSRSRVQQHSAIHPTLPGPCSLLPSLPPLLTIKQQPAMCRI